MAEAYGFGLLDGLILLESFLGKNAVQGLTTDGPVLAVFSYQNTAIVAENLTHDNEARTRAVLVRALLHQLRRDDWIRDDHCWTTAEPQCVDRAVLFGPFLELDPWVFGRDVELVAKEWKGLRPRRHSSPEYHIVDHDAEDSQQERDRHTGPDVEDACPAHFGLEFRAGFNW